MKDNESEKQTMTESSKNTLSLTESVRQFREKYKDDLMPPEEVIMDTISANHKTCGDRVVYDMDTDPCVLILHGKGIPNQKVYLLRGGCKP
jgi:hypothetical protein